MPNKKITEQKTEDVPHKEVSVEISGKESEIKEVVEKEEQLPKEKIKDLREKIENAELDDHLKIQVQSHANDLATLGKESRLKKLIEIAKTKGVIFAVNIAKKMDDPYILDMLHDSLAKEGYYKKFKL